MRLQEHMIQITRDAAKEAFRYARAVPEDKLDWKPLDLGRSVLDQCREMAMCPKWALDIISDTPQPEWDESTMEAVHKEGLQWNNIDECEAECNRRLEQLFEHFSTMTDEHLAKTKWLPYDGGREFTMAEMMDYPHWNFTYHLGQISYIQTLYGDKRMH